MRASARMQNEPQPVEPVQQTPVAETFEFQHIGDRIRRLRDGELAPAARPVRANEKRGLPTH